MKKEKSPKIEEFSWGSMSVSDHSGEFKDAKLFPGGAREWDWRETGTEHTPGIQPADVQELLNQGAETVILSKGINERLQVKSETIEMLKQKNIEFHILQSEKAVRKYNELAENKPVGGLFHSTC